MGRILKCSVFHARAIQIPNCEDDFQYCKRTYHLFLPDILCTGKARHLDNTIISRYVAVDENSYFEGEYRAVGTIPMVFALHGFGRDFKSMTGFAQGANDYHFVLILPEGINDSFNANGCCGDAQMLGLHDDYFLDRVQQQLNDEFSFLHSQYSYGIGWDNGSLLLTEALINYPHMFRAIVPISGMSARSWFPTNIGEGIGIMMHYSLDDSVMRPSGCCDDANMPTCQSDFKGESCSSFLQLFDLWARKINLCELGTSHNVRETTPSESVLVIGGEGDILYSLFQNGTETSVAMNAIDAKGEHQSATLSTSQISMNIIQQQNEYVCLTATSRSCVSNSTICVYKNMGHFDGFISTPFMSNHVMKFLANDACGINNGSLNQIPSRNKLVCGCTVNGFNGLYCLDEISDNSLVDVPGVSAESMASFTEHVDLSTASKDISSAWYLVLFGVLFIFATAIVFVICWRQKENSHDRNPNTNEEYNLRGFNPL